jgi:hypothetical protein
MILAAACCAVMATDGVGGDDITTASNSIRRNSIDDNSLRAFSLFDHDNR